MGKDQIIYIIFIIMIILIIFVPIFSKKDDETITEIIFSIGMIGLIIMYILKLL